MKLKDPPQTVPCWGFFFRDQRLLDGHEAMSHRGAPQSPNTEGPRPF